MKWTLFILHAGAGKPVYTEALAQAMARYDYRIWYENFSLPVEERVKLESEALPGAKGSNGRGVENRGEGAKLLAEPLAERIEALDRLLAAAAEESAGMAAFERAGREGQAKDVDFLMAQLDRKDNMVPVKLADYALGLVESGPGRARIEHYLFNGTVSQRNYAALYFKRRGEFDILQRAVKAGYVEEEQAFSE